MNYIKSINVFLSPSLFITGLFFVFFNPIPVQASSPEIVFDADVQLDFSGLEISTYIKNLSECDSISIDSDSIEASVPVGSTFILGTESLSSLSMASTGASASLVFQDSSINSSGYISQWIVSSTNSLSESSFVVKVSENSVDYLVTVNSSNLGYYTSDSSGQVSFSTSISSAVKSFQITRENRPSGGSFIPPSVPSFGSGSGSVKAEIELDSKTVTLIFDVFNAKYVAISENKDFAGVSWQDYQDKIEFVLSGGTGEKTLYIKFRSIEGGVSEAQEIKVNLDEENEVKIPASAGMTQDDQDDSDAEKKEEVKKEIKECYIFKSYLTIGHSGEEVRKLQELLEDLGHFTYSAGPTGYYGNITKVAVISFQKAKNLSPYPGYVGPGTRKALNESCGEIPSFAGMTQEGQDDKKLVKKSEVYTFTSYLYLNDSGDEVLKLQQVLEDLGYFTYSAGPTGYFGQVTKSAVIKFQKAKNLSPYPGWVGPGTRKALNEL